MTAAGPRYSIFNFSNENGYGTLINNELGYFKVSISNII